MTVSADIWDAKPGDILNNYDTYTAETLYAYLLMAPERVVEDLHFDNSQLSGLTSIAMRLLHSEVLQLEEVVALKKAWQPKVDKKGNAKTLPEFAKGQIFILAESAEDRFRPGIND